MKLKTTSLSLILILFLSTLFSCGFISIPQDIPDKPSANVPENLYINGEKIPSYDGTKDYAVVNSNTPFFTSNEITNKGFVKYTDLDALGRCGAALACIGPETLPTDERESISKQKNSYLFR